MDSGSILMRSCATVLHLGAAGFEFARKNAGDRSALLGDFPTGRGNGATHDWRWSVVEASAVDDLSSAMR
ncbi:hypothetical protein [Burkholderia sp. SIMBA_062]|uniref:hypothetical protein n=1 Tax=Burkholderia sp. SIMBA_062 TaxID=3085803 RepID=UPI003978D607